MCLVRSICTVIKKSKITKIAKIAKIAKCRYFVKSKGDGGVLNDRVVDPVVEFEGKPEIGLDTLLNHDIPALLLENQLFPNLLVADFEPKTVAGVAFRVGFAPVGAGRLHVSIVVVEFLHENSAIVLDLAELTAEIILRGHFSVL